MPHMSDLKIESFPIGSLACNCSIIHSISSKEAIIIDSGNDAELLLKKVEALGVQVKVLLYTHAHFDHIGAAAKVKKALNAPICLHQGDNLLYQALPVQAMMFGSLPMLPGKADKQILDEEEFGILTCNGLKNFLMAMHTPGHTQGSCCFYSESISSLPVLFSGDTLFQGSIGRTDLPGGNFDQIKNSIKQRLYTLPDETQVIPGHGPMTVISNEKRSNPFVMA